MSCLCSVLWLCHYTCMSSSYSKTFWWMMSWPTGASRKENKINSIFNFNCTHMAVVWMIVIQHRAVSFCTTMQWELWRRPHPLKMFPTLMNRSCKTGATLTKFLIEINSMELSQSVDLSWVEFNFGKLCSVHHPMLYIINTKLLCTVKWQGTSRASLFSYKSINPQAMVATVQVVTTSPISKHHQFCGDMNEFCCATFWCDRTLSTYIYANWTNKTVKNNQSC